MTRNRLNLMIFHTDGRSKTIPLDLALAAKVVTLSVMVISLAVISLTLYNIYRLSSIRSSYTLTLDNLSREKPVLQRRIKSLMEFEEKISFFLSGALTNPQGTDLAVGKSNQSMGMGGGEEQDIEGSTEDVVVPQAEQVPEAPEIFSDNGDAQAKVDYLKDRLDQLSTLAFKEKNRLDYTPSISPVTGYLTSTFGWRRSPFTGKRQFHRGIDMVNKIGTPVRAPAAGKVINVGKEDYWGNTISILHTNGIITRYGHLSSFDVAKGDSVSRGEIIGFIGMSGRSTGPHLHYQIEINDTAVDPLQFIIEDSGE